MITCSERCNTILIVLAYPHLSSLPISRWNPPQILTFMKRLSAGLSLHALELALLFKHPGYANEVEYRFMETHSFFSKPSVRYRERPYTLVKFREFAWRLQDRPTPLMEIVVGPSADKIRAVQFAEDCLSEFHKAKPDVAITHSTIPYRSVR
jgi:hypothetical protein